MPGDLYWLTAGSGVIHDEKPRAGAKIHGLQVFVNLPSSARRSAPTSLQVKAENMPIIEGNGTRVRVVLGESNGVTSQQSPAIPMTILDGRIDSGSFCAHLLNDGESTWLYAVKGESTVIVGGRKVRLSSGQSNAVSEVSSAIGREIHISNREDESVHFVLFAAKPINETYVQKRTAHHEHGSRNCAS